MTIHFRTSGFRAVIADEFTFGAVVKVTKAICSEFRSGGLRSPQLRRRTINPINRIDGMKLIFEDDSWRLVRPAGNEPLVRVYAESESTKNMEVLREQGRKYLLG
jgi:phosphomannomutase